MPDRSNYYACLGVPKDASPEEVKAAYFEAAKRLHPDANPDPRAADLFIQVQQAYDILSNPAKRSEYDKTLTVTETAKPSVKVNVLYSRQRLAPSPDSQLVYVMLDIVHTSKSNDDLTPPLNLCFVLDRSTSMQGPRIEMVKASTSQLLKQLKPQDVISIVAFSDRAEVIIPPTHVTELPRLESRILMLQTGGSTEIYQGLEAGINQIREFLGPTFNNHLILLTDGRTYGDEEACIELGEKAAAEGIGISGIGIGHEWNDVFLDKLSSVGGGSSMYISAPTELGKYLKQKFSQLEGVYAEGITFDCIPSDHVELRYAFRLEPEANPINTKAPIRLGNLPRNKNLKILLEFAVKNTNRLNEVVLGNGNISFDVPTLAIPKSRISLRLFRAVGEVQSKDLPPQPILQSLSKLTYYRMQEKALNEVKTGDIRTATRHLEQLATVLLNEGEEDLAQTVIAEAEHIKQHQKYTREGDKRIKYGTRALLLSAGVEKI